jgi:hypothetical protein
MTTALYGSCPYLPGDDGGAVGRGRGNGLKCIGKGFQWECASESGDLRVLYPGRPPHMESGLELNVERTGRWD